MTDCRRPALAVAALALAATLGLAGCSGAGSSAPQDRAQPQATQATQATRPADNGKGGNPQADPSAPAPTAYLVKTGKLKVKVGDVGEATGKVRAALVPLQGQVTGENVGESGSYDYGTMIVKVPADKMDQAMTDLGKVGDVVSREVQTEDVTSSYVDTEARIKSAEASVARLRKLVEQAKDVSQIASLESELSKREQELDGMKAQLNAMKGRVAQSTITLELSTNPPAPEEPEDATFFTGLRDGWRGMVRGVGQLLVVVGYLLPSLLPFAVLAIPASFLIRALRRQAATARAAKAARTPQPAPRPYPPVDPNAPQARPVVPPAPVLPTPHGSSVAPKPPQE